MGSARSSSACSWPSPASTPRRPSPGCRPRSCARNPGDRFVALVSRHLPALLHHRGLAAAGLILFGLAKLAAAAAMWQGQEWGGYLLAASVALLPLDLRQVVTSPTPAMSSWLRPTRRRWSCWCYSFVDSGQSEQAIEPLAHEA